MNNQLIYKCEYTESGNDDSSNESNNDTSDESDWYCILWKTKWENMNGD